LLLLYKQDADYHDLSDLFDHANQVNQRSIFILGGFSVPLDRFESHSVERCAVAHVVSCIICKAVIVAQQRRLCNYEF